MIACKVHLLNQQQIKVKVEAYEQVDGQEVYAALATADVGRGLVAGFAVAAIAIIADRLIGAAAGRARARLEGV